MIDWKTDKIRLESRHNRPTTTQTVFHKKGNNRKGEENWIGVCCDRWADINNADAEKGKIDAYQNNCCWWNDRLYKEEIQLIKNTTKWKIQIKCTDSQLSADVCHSRSAWMSCCFNQPFGICLYYSIVINDAICKCAAKVCADVFVGQHLCIRFIAPSSSWSS